MSLLRFEAVSKRYPGGHDALIEVSFALAHGEMAFVTGRSGAGKSTLLRLIHLSERASRGCVLFEQRNLTSLRGARIAQHRRRIGVVFQDHRLLADRSVFENVALPLIINGSGYADLDKRVRRALEQVGLAGYERSLPATLSSGEQQRVGIARALIGQPALLLADEPTGNLDPQLSVEIMQLFATLPDKGTAVLIASHDLHLIRALRRRVLVLDKGRLIDDIAPEELAA